MTAHAAVSLSRTDIVLEKTIGCFGHSLDVIDSCTDGLNISFEIGSIDDRFRTSNLMGIGRFSVIKHQHNKPNP